MALQPTLMVIIYVFGIRRLRGGRMQIRRHWCNILDSEIVTSFRVAFDIVVGAYGLEAMVG
jgi:hypothetical protein